MGTPTCATYRRVRGAREAGVRRLRLGGRESLKRQSSAQRLSRSARPQARCRHARARPVGHVRRGARREGGRRASAKAGGGRERLKRQSAAQRLSRSARPQARRRHARARPVGHVPMRARREGGRRASAKAGRGGLQGSEKVHGREERTGSLRTQEEWLRALKVVEGAERQTVRRAATSKRPLPPSTLRYRFGGTRG